MNNLLNTIITGETVYFDYEDVEKERDRIFKSQIKSLQKERHRSAEAYRQSKNIVLD